MLVLPKKEWWSGRRDNTVDSLRWHQKIQMWDYDHGMGHDSKITLMGYASDLGTKINQGRPGSNLGPASLRRAIGNLAWHKDVDLFDAGDLSGQEATVSQLQNDLAIHITNIHQHNSKSIVVGGSHDQSFGHFLGIYQHLKNKNPNYNLGIINFDAHLDLRSYDQGPHSGSSFRQISDLLLDEQKDFFYLCIGAQRWSNTRDLFTTAKERGVSIIENNRCNQESSHKIGTEISKFIAQLDYFLLSIDLDVFDGIYAPGVSAPSSLGLNPNALTKLFPILFQDQKILGIDITELNPAHDLDNRTARLAGVLLHQMIDFI